MSAAATAAHGAARRRPERDRDAGVAPEYDGAVPRASIAAANSAAVPNRSAGSFSSARSTAASTCAGTLRRSAMIDRGCSVMTRAMIACTDGPVNGASPASIS